ncbi:hypothetical protein GCM10027036_23420 [Flavihumibacter cheonanensis]|uniref:hypothetical protein n=1 Tax=Flavihumibacter cheonanensis TaxID=1442385 RepID=UPI001EF7C5AE|nr:hypothetical protein [Flavihumibacter cheonanensis]MCG7754471.1 hypothetical protein [Flavihumibacter cheonanensis]
MRVYLYASLIIFCSCSSGKFLKVGRDYKSKHNKGYGGQSIFSINPDNSFVYYGSGPSVFLSKGSWEYDSVNREIVLMTDNDLKPVFSNPIDTIWVDLSKKRIRVLSEKKIVFENITYYAH